MSHWTGEKANLAQSVLMQLRNYAREAGENQQVIQLRYATERLMYRISKSAHADRFVLKGACSGERPGRDAALRVAWVSGDDRCADYELRAVFRRR